jgi:hypothetical protein
MTKLIVGFVQFCHRAKKDPRANTSLTSINPHGLAWALDLCPSGKRRKGDELHGGGGRFVYYVFIACVCTLCVVLI